MKTFLNRLFAWISECAACEQAMYEALYDARIKPLIDKISCRDEKLIRLENEFAEFKAKSEVKAVEAPVKPKRKYNKKKKADEQK